MAYGARPVPQNIMSVEFKILDFMTLKQFGISIALLFLSFAIFYFFPFQPWNAVIPLFIIVIGGIVIFVPFNGEPFQEFLSSYMEAMISPQRRIWHKKGYVVKTAAEKARFYRFGNEPIPANENQFQNIPPQTTVPPQTATQLDEAEKKFLSQQDQLLQNVPINANQNSSTQGQIQAIPQAQQQSQANPQASQIPLSNSNTQNTNISPKTIQSGINLNKFTNQNQMPIAPQNQNQTQVQQFQLNPNQNSQQSTSPLQPVNEASQPIQALNQQPNPQAVPTFVKKESEQIQSNVAQVQSPNQNQTRPEDEETAVRNFIFGSVENSKGEPIKQGNITVRDFSGNTLEELSTNAAGEFKTSYEYRAGEYILTVLADGKPFNEVKISHEPVDPVPILVLPKDYDSTQRLVADEELLPKETSINGIFEGAYDSNIFNMGQDYLEDNQVQNTQVPAIQTPEISYQQDNLHAVNEVTPIQSVDSIDLNTAQADPIKASGSNVVHSAYSSQAENMFDQMMGGRITNDYIDPVPTIEDINAESKTQAASVEELPNPQSISQPAPITQTPQNQRVDYDIEIANYSEMQNANLPFETNLVTIPNTVNGILVAPNGYGLDNAQIRILDRDGILTTSMNSDQTGRFYSYSPLPLGNYMMYISKNNQNLVGFHLDINGKVIPPKYISFSY